ncbi:hypothetical protein [Yinghuangia sp. YIM S09857]|uniref:hypothetical protein n=1 Tax=Yinghuangia sp. YIM S09857 TaxID=3436929 RepID=UPI003F5299BE
MSRSIRRGAVAATLALALAPLAAACSSGTDAATSQLKPDSAHTQLGTIKVQNLSLVTGDGDSGLVSLGGAIINEGDKPETLKSVTLAGAAVPGAMKDKDGATSITIPAGGAVYLTGEKGGPSVSFSGAPDATAGKYIDVTFGFSSVGETKLGVAVHPPEGYYESLKPAAPQTATPAPSTPAPPTSAPATSAPASPPASGAASGAPEGGETPGAPASGAPTGTATAPASNTSSRPPASSNAPANG